MSNTINEHQFIDTAAAACLLGVSKSHLEKLRIEDPQSSPPFVRVRRCVRYSREQLLEWAKHRSTLLT